MRHLYYTLAVVTAVAISALTLSSCIDNVPKNGTENPADAFEKKHDTALLFVTFGSTYKIPETTYKTQMDFFTKKFPNTDIYMSYTSRTIINRLEARGTTFIPPALWMQSFLKKGYKNVYVQSLHVIPGEEYTLLRDAYVKKEYNTQLIDLHDGRNLARLGEPLLSSEESMARVARILVDDHAKHLEDGEVVAFMGHGNPESNYDYANQSYKKTEQLMQEYAREKYGNGNVFIATVDYPKMLFSYLKGELEKLPASQKKKIHLQPLMTIAGDHATNDMAGDDTMEDGKPIPLEEQSWKLQLKAMGWEVATYMKGLGDYPEINQIFLDHLNTAIKKVED